MKQLTALAPKRQEIWSHKGREYSIINLAKPQSELADTVHPVGQLLLGLHPGYPFEVAEIDRWPQDEGEHEYDNLRVLKRFRTIEDARDSIETGMIHD